MNFLSKFLRLFQGTERKNRSGYFGVERDCTGPVVSAEDVEKIMSVFRDISKYTEVQYNFYQNNDLENPLK